MTRKIEALMNAAIVQGKNFSRDNTRVEHNNGVAEVYLHGNKIAEVSDTSLRLFDGGWRSNTTKSRLNAILKANGNGTEGIYQKDFCWYIAHDGIVEEFESGMILS